MSKDALYDSSVVSLPKTDTTNESQEPVIAVELKSCVPFVPPLEGANIANYAVYNVVEAPITLDACIATVSAW